jgi:hypothetical protein
MRFFEIKTFGAQFANETILCPEAEAQQTERGT